MRGSIILGFILLSACASAPPKQPEGKALSETQIDVTNLSNRFEETKIEHERRLDEVEKTAGKEGVEKLRADTDALIEEIGYLRTKLLIVEDDSLRESNVVRHKQALKNMSEGERRCWIEYDRLQWDIQHDEATGGIDREDMGKLRKKAASCEAGK